MNFVLGTLLIVYLGVKFRSVGSYTLQFDEDGSSPGTAEKM